MSAPIAGAGSLRGTMTILPLPPCGVRRRTPKGSIAIAAPPDPAPAIDNPLCHPEESSPVIASAAPAPSEVERADLHLLSVRADQSLRPRSQRNHITINSSVTVTYQLPATNYQLQQPATGINEESPRDTRCERGRRSWHRTPPRALCHSWQSADGTTTDRSAPGIPPAVAPSLGR